MEKALVRVGLVACGLVVAATVVLLAVRLVAGPRTVHHDTVPCPPGSTQQTCTQDRYTGSLVGRSWLITLMTLSICAGAIGITLRHEAQQLSAG